MSQAVTNDQPIKVPRIATGMAIIQMGHNITFLYPIRLGSKKPSMAAMQM
jgi:hypothetical protein